MSSANEGIRTNFRDLQVGDIFSPTDNMRHEYVYLGLVEGQTEIGLMSWVGETIPDETNELFMDDPSASFYILGHLDNISEYQGIVDYKNGKKELYKVTFSYTVNIVANSEEEAIEKAWDDMDKSTISESLEATAEVEELDR